MIQTRKYSEHIDIVSPAEGFVSARNISVGQRFEKGTELYRIVDLTRVWILADVFERDAPMVQPGCEALVSLPGRHEKLPARLSESLPQFDSVSRTLKLRFEAQNPDFVFKTDMFVDVEFESDFFGNAGGAGGCRAGFRNAQGDFCGAGQRRVRAAPGADRVAGWRPGADPAGIMPGERLVVSGNFLLDSESRMKLAASGVHGAPLIDPVCGMAWTKTRRGPGNALPQHEGKTYFFCNDGCKKEFEADPVRFLAGRNRGHRDTTASGW